MQKPQSMKMFDFLYLGSIVVGLLGLILGWDILVEQMNAELATQGVESDVEMATAAIIGGAAFATAINLALWFLVSILRIEFVKWILALFLAWGIYSMLVGIASVGFSLEQITGIISTIMSIAAIYMLFQPDAKEWFAAKRGE